MAITLKGASADLLGTSRDSKPTEGVAVNTLFYELDTKDEYYFTGETWAKVGGESNGE